MKPRSAPVLVGILLLVSPASAQLAISEVLIDPVGKNSGRQIVEVVNTTAKAFTPTGWQICAPLTYAPIPRIQIPSGGVVRFHINTSGTNSATDFFFPFFRDLGSQDTFLLFKGSNFNNSNDIVDFVSWGGGTGRIGQAVSVKQWSSNSASVTLPKGEGKTISWDGRGNSHLNWVNDAVATLGAANRIASFRSLGKGCGGRSGVPVMAASSRPKIGGNPTVTLSSLPALASSSTFMVFGLSNTRWNNTPLPLDLGFMGASGCKLLVSLDFILPLGNGGNGGNAATLPIPQDTRLIGVRFYLQAWATDPSANGAGIVMSNALEGQAGN